jgi:peptidyl-dipeptidase Dcp
MDAAANPLLLDWDEAESLPPFALIDAAHFAPAFAAAMGAHRAELAAIGAAPADFDATFAAFDRAGAALERIDAVFHALAASATTPALQAAQRELAAPLAAHWSAVYQDDAVFARIDAIERERDRLALAPPQQRLVERIHSRFVRSGARLAAPARVEYSALKQRLAQLSTAFAQNLLHDEAAFALPLPAAADRAGLPDFVVAAARQAAADRGLGEVPVITLSRSLIVAFLTFSTRRDLRERAWRAWVGRGETPGPTDNRPLVREILALRRRQAELLGHANYADYALADTMAQRRERVWALFDEVWPRALRALERERAELRQAMAAEGLGADAPIEGWDWRYWAEKVRVARYAVDEAELKPYFALPAMVGAAFDCAQRLFGLRLVRRADLAAYHGDVEVYEVRAADGAEVGLFLHDNFARPAKRSGAWMSTLRVQHRNGRVSRPVVLNNANFAKAAPGEPTLLSPDDVRTLFHEFGHGLHGLLSDVDWKHLSGTAVLSDFVELPSQLFEHWAQDPGVLRRHARHWRSGEPIPERLIERLAAARRFGQGYDTVRYTASAIVDLAAHESATPIDDPVGFEQAVLAARGLPEGVGMNHRLVHFQHLFGGSGYAARYYVYLWAEVLDADAFDAFVEAGDAFDPAVAARLERWIYSRGDSFEPGAAYRAFRGRDARIEPMLRERGLDEPEGG